MYVRRQEQVLRGVIEVPGDKSISHRALMLSSLGEREVELKHVLTGADCLSTLECMRAMGAEINLQGSSAVVKGKGLKGLRSPRRILDAGNSGTTLRLLMGLVSGLGLTATFTGDESLSRRPMSRVIKPLRLMGAQIVGSEYLPISVKESQIQGISYELPMASAQVKSAILLAGLQASSATTVIERVRSRDHTERMLAAYGADIVREGAAIRLKPVFRLEVPERQEIPGDMSSAAYWIVRALVIEGSEVTIKRVGINDTRMGLIDALRRMGGRIEISNVEESGGESLADIRVRSSSLRGIEIPSDEVPRLIDEIPIMAVAASYAEGITIIRGVGELRVKESDRLKAIVTEYNKLSPGSYENDGEDLVIKGGLRKEYGKCRTFGDHRIAMSLGVMGSAGYGVELDDTECVEISYPGYWEEVRERC